MNIAELRDALFEITQDFFEGATVIWGNTNSTMPHLPTVILTLGTLNRPTQPETRWVNGRHTQKYPCTINLVVNLYTKGSQDSDFGADYYADTSQSDLTDFLNYIDSPEGIRLCRKHDIYIGRLSGPDDATFLETDVHYMYRSRMELQVGFTQYVVGQAGIMHYDPKTEEMEYVPNESGGGSEAIAIEETGYFTAAELEYENDPAEPEREE